jgi:hypothetical protein
VLRESAPGPDHRTGGHAHNANTSRARREAEFAAAMAAARQARTRLKENALNDTLAWVVENMPLTDAERERITERMREWREPS